MESARPKYQCRHEGCSKSYLRSEHLNRHTLIHKRAAFLCYLCQKRFTRNDLLNAHLRRHEKRGKVADLASKSQSNSTTSPPPVVSPPQDTGNELSPPEPTSPSSRDWQFTQAQLNDPQPVANMPIPGTTAPLTMNQFGNPMGLPIPSQQPPPQQAPPPPPQNPDTTMIYQMAQPTDVVPATTGGMLPHHLQPFQADDYTWLFQGSSLFDMPPDDYLNFHFGGGLGPGSPTGYYARPIEQPAADQGELPIYTARDHERLINECPNLLSSPLRFPAQISRLIHLALGYCDIYLPLFHRPTFDVATCSSNLLLALCSLGSFLCGSAELYETGKMLHKHLWSSAVEKASASPRVEMSFLQSLVIIEHICTYTMRRQQHELAEIVHGMIVTLARRNNLLTESIRHENASRQSLDMKWRDWAQRESVIRIAYTIFVNDVQYSVFFSHHALLSANMMKLPLPSPSTVWEASTAPEWETQMRQLKRSTRSRYYSLDSAVESIMSLKDPDHKREFMQCFNVSNPLSIHFLIHGIAAAISDAKYRGVASSTSLVTQSLQMVDFDEALRHWKACFDKLPESDAKSRIAWCSQVMYHFSAVLLRNNLSDIQMAAGSAYTSGRAVTPQCAQAAYSRLISTDPISHDSYLHGLEVVSLCLQDLDGVPGGGGGAPPVGSAPSMHFGKLEPRPLWQTYGAFLGLLVVWARALGLEHEDSIKRTSIGSWAAATLSSNLIPNAAVATLSSMYQRELTRVESAQEDIQTLKIELRQLIGVVCERLTARPWEISHEAARILTSLGEREVTGRRPSDSHR